MVCLVQGRWWIWDAHSHGECGDSFQNRQTKGEKERFPMPVLILPELKFMPCWWRQASSGGWDWNDNEKRLFYSVIQSVRSIDMCWKHEPNELTYVHMRTHVRVRFDLICFFYCFQSEIKILRTSVFVDPYEEADAQVWIPWFVQTV